MGIHKIIETISLDINLKKRKIAFNPDIHPDSTINHIFSAGSDYVTYNGHKYKKQKDETKVIDNQPIRQLEYRLLR